MRPARLAISLLLMMAVETMAQVAFKLAGDGALPLTLDADWALRLGLQPWPYVALACLGVSFGIYLTMLRGAAIGPVFAVSHLDIVAVTLVAVWLFGDRLTLPQALGCCAIVAGVMVLALTEGGHADEPKATTAVEPPAVLPATSPG